MTNEAQNFVNDIFYIERLRKKRRSSLEVLQSQLCKGWRCEGYYSNYELWDEKNCGSTWVFTTLSEMRDFCRQKNLLKQPNL